MSPIAALHRFHFSSIRAFFHVLILACLAASLAACGDGADSSSALLPALLTQPADQSVTEGSGATFKVTTEGQPPLTYQWTSSREGEPYAPIAGATKSSYVTGATTLGQSSTRYRVVVTNIWGGVTSSAATLTVRQKIIAPSISVQPAGQTATAPDGATFHVTATGTAPSYEWQSSADAGAAFEPVPAAADAPTLAIAATTVADDGRRYRVRVSNAAGSVTSEPATLTVRPTPTAPRFTTEPVSQTLVAGQAAGFGVVVAGTPAPAVRWQLDGADLADGAQTRGTCAGASAAGSRTATLTLTGVPLGCSGARLDAVASNGVEPDAKSAEATLTVNPAPAAPSIRLQPADASVQAPAVATFTAAADGVPSPAVQWQQSRDGGATWANINGATKPGYTTPATTPDDTAQRLRAVFTNASGVATSQAAVLTVVPAEPTLSLLTGDIGGRGNFDGMGTAARFSNPASIALDAAGNAYVADRFNNLIRKVTPTGLVSTFAGSGQSDPGMRTAMAAMRRWLFRKASPSTSRAPCTWPTPAAAPSARSRLTAWSARWRAWPSAMAAPTARAPRRASTPPAASPSMRMERFTFPTPATG